MLTKFESKSNRVKGLAFHPKRPWILATLHNGSIQWWDYRMGTLLDRFDEHEGPVRGVAFHPTQPLFVSGGDDYKIRVWNYKQRRCLFTLHGHLDFVRTVFFHHEAPWIVSASDDYTIRIWNWQSRSCLAVLTGHHHYVMSAQFHPTDDLIVSSAYDFTIRVWDISGLRKKHSAGSGGPASMGGLPGGIGGGSGLPSGLAGMSSAAFGSSGGPGGRSGNDDGRSGGGAGDLFGNTDAVVKYVLEGHDKCVNWAMFHPTLPLIVSCGDDRQIKIWRMSETRAWEVDTFRGHYNNVSSVLFHPRAELLLSAAEDKTIRVWDMQRRTIAQTFRREHDRFWILVAHPHINLFAAGHDSGLIVFKLERERPAMMLHQNTLVFVQGKHLCTYDLATGQEVTGALVKRGTGLQPAPRTLSYNPTERLAAVAVAQGQDAGLIELYHLDRQDDPAKLAGHAAVFVARNRLAVLDKAAGFIHLYDTRGTKLKEIKMPNHVAEMFYAGIGHVLVSTGVSVELWDVQQGVQVAELVNVNNVKYVAFSPDMTQVALLSKHVITHCAARTLTQAAVVHETIRVKSAVFDGPVLVYTTLNHIKYALPNGDNGILCTLDQPLYLAHVAQDSITALTREHKVTKLRVDGTEYRFKLALITRQYGAVLNIIQNSNLLGQSIIAYLQKKGYPEVALHFVQDPPTRLDLALECGQLDAAREAADVINQPAAWHRLAKEAMRQGNVLLAEHAMQRVQNMQGLSLLYLATGQTDKLAKMMAIARHRNDPLAIMHNAVLLGHVEERVRVLIEADQMSLAWLTCKTHGLDELADQIAQRARPGITPEAFEALQPAVAKVQGANPELLVPRRPLAPMVDNWPLIESNRGYFAGATGPEASAAAVAAVAGQVQQLALDDNWAGTADPAAVSATSPGGADAADAEDADGGWGFDDLDLPAVTPTSAAAAAAAPAAATTATASGADALAAAYTSLPLQGASKKQSWIRGSNRAIDHIVAGSYETAMAILNRNQGISHFAPLRSLFLTLHAAASAHAPGQLELPIARNWQEPDALRSLPVQPLSLDTVTSQLFPEAGRLTLQNKLPEALALWRYALHALVVVADEKPDAAATAVALAREYVRGLTMELARRELEAADPRRSVELAAYFAAADLDPAHRRLALQSALLQANRAGYLPLAAHFARRLLDLNPPPAVAQKAAQLIAAADAAPPNDALPAVDYDAFHVLPVCAASFTAIHGGEGQAKCRFCKAAFKVEFAGAACAVCQVATVAN
ncbi:hypothetical protein H9P43_009873 [Blastocladiella emersonii ATCC 22665]|nr:hypothetical protein H9P43_009873 [Blastocladiella emersonii ATCC 22665]